MKFSKFASDVLFLCATVAIWMHAFNIGFGGKVTMEEVISLVVFAIFFRVDVILLEMRKGAAK